MASLQLRQRLLTSGVTPDELRRALRVGDLTLLRRGAYLAGQPPGHAEARHLLLTEAARQSLCEHAVVSHVSAALIHGIRLWHTPLRRVHVTRTRGYGGRRGDHVHVHVAPLAANEVSVVDGVRVTSVERTLVDIARTLPFEQAVVAADGALDLELTTLQRFWRATARAKGWPGAPAARRVAGFATHLSESVGESRSRVRIALAGLPAPELQWEVRDRAGRHVATSDFGWPAHRLVAEFDGKVKYGRLLRPGQDPGDVVFAEKQREDAIRAQDIGVTRWTWQDMDTFTTALRARLE